MVSGDEMAEECSEALIAVSESAPATEAGVGWTERSVASPGLRPRRERLSQTSSVMEMNIKYWTGKSKDGIIDRSIIPSLGKSILQLVEATRNE